MIENFNFLSVAERRERRNGGDKYVENAKWAKVNQVMLY
jgi:hypothetical protein